MGINATTRLRVEVVVDSDEPEMLAAAGLGETTVEWGVRPLPYSDRVLATEDRGNAELIVRASGYGVVVSREVAATEWREVPL